MLSFLINRLWQSIVLLLIVTVITFFLINLAPGGPASLMRMDATAEERAALSERMGLDKPVIVRYGQWLGNTLTGDLGESLSSGQPVIKRVAERFPNTVQLALYTLIFSVGAGVILGIISAVRRNSVSDYSINLFTAVGLSVPAFWLAIMLIYLFSVVLHWLPSSGVGTGTGIEKFKYMILPVLILSTTTLPTIVRFTRSSMLEVISQNYVRTARAKGAKEWSVIYYHALRNALIPVVTVIGVLVPRLLGGAVITETVFGWPGMGRLIVEAAQGRDYNLVMGVTVIVTFIVITTNFLVDIIYSRIDPRVKNF
ncbi:ABC transporter permease [Neobacillus pocheonensis]|uniref:ABC transporter permease n=1 Tax=Neobacillus pocheonensis TaxID=363869 RepID=UPI003D274693